MPEFTITKLREQPMLCDSAAQWFSHKWGIPAEAYRESIRQCLQQNVGVPQWYVVLDTRGNIIAGAGIIENDFHDREDLRPNLCALFVEEAYRKQQLAKRILDFARNDMSVIGIETLYLVTDHTTFYEKCGWTFLTMVNGEDGQAERMYAAVTKLK